MWRKLRMAICLLATVLISACARTEIPEVFDEAEVTQTGEKIARMAIERDMSFYEEYMSTLMKYSIPEADLLEVIEEYDPTEGAITDISSAVVGDSDESGDYVTCVTVVKCEKGRLQFTMTFNEDMLLTGFYIK